VTCPVLKYIFIFSQTARFKKMNIKCIFSLQLVTNILILGRIQRDMTIMLIDIHADHTFPSSTEDGNASAVSPLYLGFLRCGSQPNSGTNLPSLRSPKDLRKERHASPF
jgi:hypothetical protein